MAKDAWQYPGARWWKFDFHTHTPASRCSKWPSPANGEEGLTPRQWLLKFMRAEVDCVAVTDHNTGEWLDRLKDAYRELEDEKAEGFRELHLFPGVELSVNGGVHLLAILDKNKSKADIDALLGKVDYQGSEGDSDGVTRKSPVEVIEAIGSVGGLAIPAHVDQAKGLLRLEDADSRKALLDANTLRQVIRDSRILAMEVVDRTIPKPRIYEEENCHWTEVVGTGCHSFRGDKTPGQQFTWVKMATPSLEGLRLALLDGGAFSIRRSDDAEAFSPSDLPAHFVESIEVGNARYMGHGKPERLEFSPWFNALVGGRGTGKSTIVHAIRLVHRREAELGQLDKDPARRTFEDFIKEPKGRNDAAGALDYQGSRRTEIVATVKNDGATVRLRWRQDGSGPVIEEGSNGGWMPDISQSVSPERFPIRIFSQGQISSLAGESQQALIGLVDQAAGMQPAHRQLEVEIQRFLSLRAQAREMASRLTRLSGAQAELKTVQRKLELFEGGRHAEILREYQLRQRQNREVDRQLEEASKLADLLREQASRLVAADAPAGLFDPGQELDAEALGITEGIHAAVREAAEKVAAAAERLAQATLEQREQMQQSRWFLASVEAANRYKELAGKLKEQGVGDPAEYGKLVQERQRLEGEIKDLQSLETEHERLLGEAEGQRKRVREARRQLSSRRESFIQSTIAGNPYVKMSLVPYGRDHRSVEREFREALGVTDDRFGDDVLEMDGDRPKGGAVAELLEGLARDQGGAEEFEKRLDRLARRLEQATFRSGDLGGKFNNYLKRAGQKQPELLDRLLVWSPQDAVDVEYSPKGDGENFRSILQASAGQRAAAMLAFLLAYGKEPLVLDQPEDDLDNHLIYELVVRQVRENKLRRQLIIVTHNPNIVVNGDAELVHAFDFTDGQCRVVKSGSLQESRVREEVCRVMEGGREAFERRYRRLGKEIAHV